MAGCPQHLPVHRHEDQAILRIRADRRSYQADFPGVNEFPIATRDLLPEALLYGLALTLDSLSEISVFREIHTGMPKA